MDITLRKWIPETDLRLVRPSAADALRRRHRLRAGDAALFTNGKWNRMRLLLIWPNGTPSVVLWPVATAEGTVQKLLHAALRAVVQGCDTKITLMEELVDSFDVALIPARKLKAA
jgi:hypothetical protein